MPYDVFWSNKGVEFRFYGKITVKELFLAHNSLSGDERFESLEYMVTDVIDVKNIHNFDPERILEQIRVIAATDNASAKINPHISVANVADNDTALALFAYYESEIAASPWQYILFKDRKTLEDWLHDHWGGHARDAG